MSDEIILFVARFATRGYAPSVREIADAVGLASAGSVHRHLGELRRRQLIDWIDGDPRTIHLTRSGKQHAVELLSARRSACGIEVAA